jgi:hypothetical protein
MKPDVPLRTPRSRAARDRVNGPRVPNARVPVGHRFNPYKLFNGTFIPGIPSTIGSGKQPTTTRSLFAVRPRRLN